MYVGSAVVGKWTAVVPMVAYVGRKHAHSAEEIALSKVTIVITVIIIETNLIICSPYVCMLLRLEGKLVEGVDERQSGEPIL